MKRAKVFHSVKSVNMPNGMGTEPSNQLLKQGASLFKHLESLSSLSWLMPNIWEDFAWSAGKRLQICTYQKCHIIFQGGMDFIGSPRLLPSFPPETACLLHLQTSIFLPWSSSTPILSSISYNYNSKTSELSSPLSVSSQAFPSLLSFILFSNSIKTVPLLLSPLLIFILPSQTCPLPLPHTFTNTF